MILHVTGERCVFNNIVKLARVFTLKLIENLFEWLSYDISKDIHSATMRHANNNFTDTRFDQCIEGYF